MMRRRREHDRRLAVWGWNCLWNPKPLSSAPQVAQTSTRLGSFIRELLSQTEGSSLMTPQQPESRTVAGGGSNDLSQETHTNGFANFEAWGIKLPLPRWGVYCVAVLTILGIGLFLYSKFVTPILSTGRSTIETNLAEYQKHFPDTTRSEQPLFDSPDLGFLKVAYYSSD